MRRLDKSRFERTDFRPSYLAGDVRAVLPDRSRLAVAALAECRSCPRDCKADRLANEAGVCNTGRHVRVSAAFAHHGEEACLSGTRGSGTIFFSSCNLHCVYCQNWDISQRTGGDELCAEALAERMLELQRQGCHNINLVTPSHVVPQIVESLAIAVERGLSVPVVYNSGGYDSIDSLRRLAGLVDIYMPDFKYWSSASAQRYSHATDYPDRAREAVREMHRQVGDLTLAPGGLACRGLLVRHLVLPGLINESREILRFLAKEISPDTYVNIMAQYRPEHDVGTIVETGRDAGTIRYEELDRGIRDDELAAAYRAARDAGLWRFDLPTGIG